MPAAEKRAKTSPRFFVSLQRMREVCTSLEIGDGFEVTGNGLLPSRFAVTKLATATLGAVAISIAALLKAIGLSANCPYVSTDRRRASLWFARSIYPINWEMPPVWDAIAGDYQGRDGWIKLHTNLPHHREATLSVLECSADRVAVSAAIKTRSIDDLEADIVHAGGVAAAMRTRAAWLAHPQGQAVASEPLVAWNEAHRGKLELKSATRTRPLAGLRVLDLTRVLAGPVATRTLAGFGADVLRIDPTDWNEANVVPDITLGKRCSRLDLRNEQDRKKFEQLLQGADLLVHGYRPGALERLGYGETARKQLTPDLIEVSLDAYGWTGPWSGRRGFDSLVQMSCGIADAGMTWAEKDTPTPLPVQALDHATGYLMAAAAIRAITVAVRGNGIKKARLSLARTAELLVAHPQSSRGLLSLHPEPSDFSEVIEHTPWGQAHRLKAPITIDGTPMVWHLPASELGSSLPHWN